MRKNQNLYDILFSLLIILVVICQIVAGILGLIYLPELNITSEFWLYFIKSILIVFTTGSVILLLGIMAIFLQLIISNIKFNKNA